MAFYPRSPKSRADAFGRGVPFYPRNDLQRSTLIAREPAGEFNLDGIIVTSGFGQIYEGTFQAGSVSLDAFITHAEESWNVLLGAANAVSSAFLGGVDSIDVSWTAANADVVRTSGQKVSLKVPANNAVVAAVTSFQFTAPQSAFFLRTGSYALGNFQLVPLSLTRTGSLSPGEINIASGGHVINLVIGNTEESWHTDVATDTAIASTFLAGISSNGIGFTYANLSLPDPRTLRITFPAVESFDISTANTHLSALIPATAFNVRQNTVTVATLFTIVNTTGND